MRFLIDAQLPEKMVDIFSELGLESMHVAGLPNGDGCTDQEIIAFADTHAYVIVSKDTDFYYSHIIKGSPKLLWMISTGNIKNRALFDHIRKNIQSIKSLLRECKLIELSQEGVIGHQ